MKNFLAHTTHKALFLTGLFFTFTTMPLHEPLPDYFFTPLEYNERSITFFLKEVFNHPRYPQDFLALNFLHIISGVELAPQNEHPRHFARKILRLFNPKLQTIYINPYAFYELAIRILPSMQHCCKRSQEKQEMVELFKQYIGNCLVEDFDSLKTTPDKTLTKLASDLYELTLPSDDQDISVRELQHAIHHFLSRGCAQLIWSPADQIQTWESIKSLAKLFEKYTQLNIIDGEMLDDLLWILIQRYGFFLQIAAQDLDGDCLKLIREEIQKEKATLWLYEEREKYITTKQQYLMNVLLEVEVTAQAYSVGLIARR